MAVTINASTTTGLVQSADTSGSLNIQSNGTTVLGVTSTGTSVTGTQSVSGNLSFNSGYGSSAVAYGCRAWVNFNGTTNTGGFCTIRASGNVTSVADNGTGDYTVNFTSDMPDANFAHSGSGGKLTTGSIADIDVSRVNSSASNIRIETVRGSSNTVTDFEYIAVAIFR
jgi:hypothetical protein